MFCLTVGRGCPFSVEKEFVRVQIVVTKVFENVSMNLVGPALQDCVDIAAAVSSLGSIVEACLNFELLDHIRAR